MSKYVKAALGHFSSVFDLKVYFHRILVLIPRLEIMLNFKDFLPLGKAPSFRRYSRSLDVIFYFSLDDFPLKTIPGGLLDVFPWSLLLPVTENTPSTMIPFVELTWSICGRC